MIVLPQLRTLWPLWRITDSDITFVLKFIIFGLCLDIPSKFGLEDVYKIWAE